nr:vacuolar sorting protein VPS33/slp1 [Polyrhizophydium stewartii]
MLAIISQGGVQESDRQRFHERGRLTVEEIQALNNLSLLNVRLSPSLDNKRKDRLILSLRDCADKVVQNPYVQAEIVKRSADKTFKFENSRYTPMLKYIAEDQCKSTVDQHVFPWVKDPPVGEYDSSVAAGGRKKTWATRKPTTASASSLQQQQAAARVDEDLRQNGPRIILFVLGGITYSEMRAVYELRKDLRRDVIIGSTHIWQPDGFVEALKDLHRGQGDSRRFIGHDRGGYDRGGYDRGGYDQPPPQQRGYDCGGYERSGRSTPTDARGAQQAPYPRGGSEPTVRRAYDPPQQASSPPPGRPQASWARRSPAGASDGSVDSGPARSASSTRRGNDDGYGGRSLEGSFERMAVSDRSRGGYDRPDPRGYGTPPPGRHDRNGSGGSGGARYDDGGYGRGSPAPAGEPLPRSKSRTGSREQVPEDDAGGKSKEKRGWFGFK